MDYQTLINEYAPILAGCVTGLFASGYWMDHLRLILRVRRESGVPLSKLDKVKAKKIDNALRNWSAMVPVGDPYAGLDKLVREFPIDVAEAFDAHIHNRGVPFEPTWAGLYRNSCILKVRVAEFYQEHAVQAYLNKQGAQVTAQSL